MLPNPTFVFPFREVGPFPKRNCPRGAVVSNLPAGSIYTTVQVIFYGDTYRRAANVILRRVNDVPGSTAVQRRWHIERIEWE